MIKFIFRRYGMSATGHAEFAERGSDIACAAFSAVFLSGLMCFKKTDVKINQTGQVTSFVLKEVARTAANLAILSVIKKQIKIIARFYPQCVQIIQR